jgi:DNA-binding response OmpR family regulator
LKQVLLVEDSEECRLVVQRALANTNFELVGISSYQEALSIIKARGAQFDLVILEVILADGDGFKILDALRAAGMSYETPVFFLTRESELSSKLTAFSLGADDYLVKPINPIELRARVEVRLKKAGRTSSDVRIRGDLLINTSLLRASRRANKTFHDLGLTSKEFKILSFLVQNEGQVFSRSELVKVLWDKDVHILDRTIDSHIYGLRKKMGPLSHCIESIAGAGYRFSLDQRAGAAKLANSL